MDRRNTLIVWDRIGDYHRARVRSMEMLDSQGMVFTADFGGADGLYGWKNTDSSDRHVVLSGKPVDKLDIFRRASTFYKYVREKDISRVAIAGYGRPEYLLLIILARIMGCRVTLFAESWYGGNRFKNRLKGFFLKVFCHRFLVSGVRARNHFHQQLGIPTERIRMGYSTVDNDHFAPREETMRCPVVLSVARFSPEKNLPLLIEAFLSSRLADSYRLRLIGGGPQKDELVELAGGNPAVEFVDWVGYGDLPAEYLRASYFILPSLFEPWGLVVNEAMAAGLPVIVSDACGCQPDLIAPGSGFVFASGNKDQLVNILNGLPESSDPAWEAMSSRSRELVDRFSCDEWAKQLIHSFQ